MKWSYSIKNKAGASIILLTLCVLVLVSNYLDQLHSENVQKSITTLYEDRLIVEEYILKMTRDVYKIREYLFLDNGTQNHKKEIEKLVFEFKETYKLFNSTNLTLLENKTALELFDQLKKFENLYLNNDKLTLDDSSGILKSLESLSKIQLYESELIMKDIKAEFNFYKLLSQFGFGIVFLILIVLQVLVFSGSTLLNTNVVKNPSLN